MKTDTGGGRKSSQVPRAGRRREREKRRRREVRRWEVDKRRRAQGSAVVSQNRRGIRGDIRRVFIGNQAGIRLVGRPLRAGIRHQHYCNDIN